VNGNVLTYIVDTSQGMTVISRAEFHVLVRENMNDTYKPISSDG
jgi:hypothetical protein